MGRRWATALAAGALMAGLGLGASARSARAVGELPNTTTGYIPMSDGASLHYSVTLPAATGRFPIALVYSPYADGSDPFALGNDPLTSRQLLNAGYAVLGVNLRGTGCSSGSFDILQPQEGIDGAEVIEWAGVQPWSDGRVGMFGLSYPGISQFSVAAHHPAHLRAIAPFSFLGDLYRDAAYPGGIYNTTFPPLWTFTIHPAFSDGAATDSTASGDTDCPGHVAARQVYEQQNNPYSESVAAPYADDDLYVTRSPVQYFASIAVPALACIAWQDDDIGSRGIEAVDALNPTTTWILGTNGYHGMCDDPQFGLRLVAFFDRFVKGVANGFDATPHVTLIHEAHVDGGGKILPGNGWVATDVVPTAFSTPSWTTTFPSWPVTVDPTTIDLHADGRESYAYPLASSGSEDGGLTGNLNAEWKVPSNPAGSVTFTTAALDHDAEFFGPGSVNLQLVSSATDTDVQATLSEVRPDGNEVYIQRGWLRASHEKLDPAKSTVLRPYQTHQAVDQQPLVPHQPTPLRVELFPFDYTFRAGSHVRLTIDAPTANTGLFGFDFLKTPAINTILHAQLVLGRVPGVSAETPYPACDTIINQPCRTNTAPVPPGTMHIGTGR